MTHFLHSQVVSAYEAVAPDPKNSQFETKRVRTGSGSIDLHAWLCCILPSQASRLENQLMPAG